MGFINVPYNETHGILLSLRENQNNPFIAAGGSNILRPLLLSELLLSNTATQGIEPNAFFHEPIIHIGNDVKRSVFPPLIEVIAGRGIDLTSLSQDLPEPYALVDKGPLGLNPHDEYLQALVNKADPPLPQGTSLESLLRFVEKKGQTPITTKGHIGRLLTQRTLFIEGFRVPQKNELSKGGFSLEGLNRFYSHFIDPKLYSPYLLMILQRVPLTVEDYEGDLVRQTVRLIKEITSSRLTTHVALRTVKISGNPEQDRTNFLDALQASVETLKP